MRFAQPWALALLAPIALALWARLARPEWFTAALSLSTGRDAGRIPVPAWARAARRAETVLLALACAFAAVALARPQKSISLGMEPEKGIDIMLAIDTSGSMRALDFDPLNRIQAAVKHAAAFVQGRRNDRIGIVVFGAVAFLECPLTLDYSAIIDLLKIVEPDMTGTDGTAIGDAIATATNHLQDSQAASKVIVLLTDGRNNAGAVDPLTAAKAAAALGIKLYTIGCGAHGPSMYPMEDPVYGTRWVQIEEDLDEDTLQQLAHRTGGEYYRASNTPELDAVFKRIDSLERSKVEAPPSYGMRDLYALFLVPAMLCALGHLLLSRGLFLKVP
jgi:Ca-activated chloride channel family protein